MQKQEFEAEAKIAEDFGRRLDRSGYYVAVGLQEDLDLGLINREEFDSRMSELLDSKQAAH